MKHFMTALAVSVCLAGGCATDEESPDDIEAVGPTDVARVTTSDGSLWRFVETEPGDIVVLGQTLEGRAPALNVDPSLERLTYIDMYKKLTSAPVPATLVQAQARVDAVTETEPTPDASGLVNETSPPPGHPPSAITASAFQDHYCGGGYWDYSTCWPGYFGNPKVQHKAYSMYGSVARVSHTALWRLRAKKHWYSSWATSIEGQALPGYVYSVQARYFGYRRWRVFEVTDNSAYEIRYAAYGSD